MPLDRVEQRRFRIYDKYTPQNFHNKNSWRLSWQPMADTKSANADKQDDSQQEQSSIANYCPYRSLRYWLFKAIFIVK